MIYLSAPHLTGEEKPHLAEVFESNWITSLGTKIDLLEQRFQDYLAMPYAVALHSGTAAIHLALKALGVQKEDWVICSSFTFIASANPILYEKATPVLIDSEPITWNMSPKYLEEAILQGIKKNKKPKAIVLVHLYGQAAQMEELVAIAHHYQIPMIEDAAEALGSSYKDKKLGSWGDMSIISLNGNKIITASGGGMLLAKEERMAQKVKFLASQAREPFPYYQHEQVGYNYRMSNVLAAIACGQMEVIDARVESRRNNFFFYKKALQKIDSIAFWEAPQGSFSNHWLSCILFENEAKIENIRKNLLNKKIETRYLWKPLHLQPLLKDAPYFGEKVAESLFKRGLCLPSSSSLQASDLAYIAESLVQEIKKSDYIAP